MPISTVYIRSQSTGYAHPKCYLGHTNGCSTKISGEHYISHALLNTIERQKKTIDILGLSWLPKDRLTSVGKTSLVSNILCTQHNSDLSPLDSAIGALVEAIGDTDAEYQEPSPQGRRYAIDGAEIERWILKTILGLVASGQIKQQSGEPFTVDPRCVQLLCVPHARWPSGWGLYLSTAGSTIYHSSSFELLPKHNPETGVLMALDLKLNGVSMHFLMGKPDQPGAFGIHRPSAMVFRKDAVLTVLELSWPRRKAKGVTVTFAHTGTYSGPAPGHPSASST